MPTSKYLPIARLICAPLLFAMLSGCGSHFSAPPSRSRQATGILYTLQPGFGPNWQMVSAPYTSLPSFASLGAYAAVWQPAQNSYAVTPTPPADQFRPGQGCWVFVSNPIPIPGPGTPVDNTKPASVTLQVGWNQVGNPFLSAVPLSNLSIQSSGGTSISLSAATSQGTASPLYAYDSANGVYVAYSSTTQTLDPWLGAWLYSSTGGTLIINPPQGAAAATASISSVSVNGPSARTVSQSGPLPTGTSPAPVADSTTVTVAGTTANIGITSALPVDSIFVSIRGSGDFVAVLLAAASRQAAGNHYALQVSLAAAPAGTIIIDVSTKTGAQVSQPVSFTVNLPTAGGGTTGALAASAWPKFHADAKNTGRSSARGATGVKKWTFATAGPVTSSPSVGADGTIYVGSQDNNVYAINPDGSLKWSFATGAAVESSPAIGADGTIYIGSDDGSVYALNPGGTKKWTFATGGSISRSSVAIATDGTIYVGSTDNSVYAINPDGSKKWSFATGGVILSTPAIATDGTIYVGSFDSSLYALNPDGSKKWGTAIGGPIEGPPAVGADGTVYVRALDYFLYSFAATTGVVKWKEGNTFDRTGGVSAPAVGTDSTVYFGSENNAIWAIDGTTGSHDWNFATKFPSVSSPAIAADNTIYVGDDGGNLYALKGATGAQVWTLATGGPVRSSPAIGADGTIYVGSNDGNLYAIR